MQTTLAGRKYHPREEASEILVVNAGTIMGSNAPEVYGTKEVAEILGMHSGTIRRWCAEGRLKATQGGPGNAWLITAHEVDRVLIEGLPPREPWSSTALPTIKMDPRSKRPETGAKMVVEAGAQAMTQKYWAKTKALVMVALLAFLAAGVLRLFHAT